MARLSFLAGAALAVATGPLSLIAQQQGRVTRDAGDVDPTGTRLLQQPSVSARRPGN